MRKVTAKELRQTTAAVLDRVRNGEAITVTHRGRPIALLSPLDTRHRSPADRVRHVEGPARPAGRRALGSHRPVATTSMVLFDTDILIWYFRGSAAARRLLEMTPQESLIGGRAW